MKLELIRTDFTEISTIGNLLVDGIFFCYTLEDKDRQRKDGKIIPWNKNLKVYGETAIPYGNYEVITNYSNRFGRVMPLLLNVPDFKGARIHNGNTADHTNGCVLLGMLKHIDFIGSSKKAFGLFMPLLQSTLRKEKVRLEIK